MAVDRHAGHRIPLHPRQNEQEHTPRRLVSASWRKC
jgi:hypothetical protein